MSQIVVGVADCRISDDPDSVLATFALGSCIAVAIHDPIARLAGLLHFMLPDSTIDAAKARDNPFMFADTGIPRLFRAFIDRGARPKGLIVHLAGGASMVGDTGAFDIGKRNQLAARKLLWKHGILVQTEIVGGSISRTVRLEVGSGRYWMREGGNGCYQELPAVRRTAKGGS